MEPKILKQFNFRINEHWVFPKTDVNLDLQSLLISLYFLLRSHLASADLQIINCLFLLLKGWQHKVPSYVEF